jgi:hypothetical protein
LRLLLKSISRIGGTTLRIEIYGLKEHGGVGKPAHGGDGSERRTIHSSMYLVGHDSWCTEYNIVENEMKRKPRPHVWVVELLHKRNWLPCIACDLDKKSASQVALKEWRKNNPDDKFRVAKYVRVK